MGIYIEQLGRIEEDPVLSERLLRETQVQGDFESTRRTTYKQLNPHLISPAIYRNSNFRTPEPYRIAYTRLRLSSHHLKIETGRWSRIPREERLCPCGSVQDEVHVLLYCPLLENIRGDYTNINFESIDSVMDHIEEDELCKYFFTVTKVIAEYN